MDRTKAIQVFAALAILVGLLISYFPPNQNAAALWALVSMFLGYAVRDLFGHTAEVPQPGPTSPASLPAPGAAP